MNEDPILPEPLRVAVADLRILARELRCREQSVQRWGAT
jgi:hypothetical protein